MRVFKLAFRTIASGVFVVPALALSSLVFAADNTQTPGAKEPGEVDSQSVSPYVPPVHVYVPDSSKAVPGDVGKHAHTNILIQNQGATKSKAISDMSQPEPAANPSQHNRLEPNPDK